MANQDFASKQDTAYNWITFFPDHTDGNWCDIKDMRKWDGGSKNTFYKRHLKRLKSEETQRDMTAAVKAAEMYVATEHGKERSM